MRSRRAPRNPSSPGRQIREDAFRWQICCFSSGYEQLCLRHHLEENWDSVKLISQIKRLGVNDLQVINMHAYKMTVPTASVLGSAKVSAALFQTLSCISLVLRMTDSCQSLGGKVLLIFDKGGISPSTAKCLCQSKLCLHLSSVK